MWPIYLLLTTISAYVAYHRFFHPLAKIPGPFLASITPLWLVWQCMHHRRPSLDMELHERYGSVVRIAPDEIIFSNPEYFKVVYGAGSKFTKGRYYECTKASPQPGWDGLDMLPEKDIDKLRIQKRLAGPVYSFANVKRHEALIDNNIRRWFKRLSTMTGKPLDFYHEIELLMLDTMSELTYGQPWGVVERGDDHGNMDRMWKFWEHIGWTGHLPWYNALEQTIIGTYMAVMKKLPPIPMLPYAQNQVANYRRLEKSGKGSEACIFDDLSKLAKEKPGFRPNWAVMLSVTDLGAGVDTSSQTLSATITGICRNKDALEHVRAELESGINAGRISKGTPVSYDEAAKMVYLQACIHEAMRLWPNIAMSIPRIVPSGGTVAIDGYYIPEGYTVGMNARKLGRSNEIFGPDTDSFRPERWLQASKEQRNDMEQRNLAFGGPSRKCLGMHMAWVVVTKVLASFFLEFDVKVLNELNGPAGPGGGKWIEKGAFPHRWFGWEIEVQRR